MSARIAADVVCAWGICEKKTWIVLACVGVAVLSCGYLLVRSFDDRPALELTETDAMDNDRGREVDADYVILGGVRRRRSDVVRPKQDQSQATLEDRRRADYGRTPPVKVDANPQVKSVVEALRDKKHPERLSVLLRPKQFERAAYEKDPQAYLNTVEPGRVWQSAQPGKDVPRLSRLSPYVQQVEQGQSVELRVIGVPEMPVSFTSFDLGHFENQLPAITVKADKSGIAKVKFFGAPGTIADVNILSASPVTSGQVKFVVNVVRPSPSAAIPESTGRQPQESP